MVAVAGALLRLGTRAKSHEFFAPNSLSPRSSTEALECMRWKWIRCTSQSGSETQGTVRLCCPWKAFNLSAVRLRNHSSRRSWHVITLKLSSIKRKPFLYFSPHSAVDWKSQSCCASSNCTFLRRWAQLEVEERSRETQQTSVELLLDDSAACVVVSRIKKLSNRVGNHMSGNNVNAIVIRTIRDIFTLFAKAESLKWSGQNCWNKTANLGHLVIPPWAINRPFGWKIKL